MAAEQTNPKVAATLEERPFPPEATEEANSTARPTGSSPGAHPTHLHVVERGSEKGLPEDGSEQADITGYDPHLMRARAILSVDEEKKVLRRVDWRLLPLLSLMFVVKNVDIANVCLKICVKTAKSLMLCLGLKRSYHGQRNASEYHDRAAHHRE